MVFDGLALITGLDITFETGVDCSIVKCCGSKLLGRFLEVTHLQKPA